MSDPFSIEEARRIRAHRAEALASIRDGDPTLLSVLRKPPAPLGGADIYTVLVSCPGIGPAGARTVLERADVWPLTLIRQLTKLERLRIIDNLPPRART